MDSDSSVMDYGTEDERSETQEDIPELPDDVLAIIFLNLSWKDILNARLVSRGFYNIIRRKWYLLNKREVSVHSVECIGNHKEPAFSFNVSLKNAIGFDFYRKTIRIQGDEELVTFLQMFCVKDIDFIRVPPNCNSWIFDSLSRSLPIETNIRGLDFTLLDESDFKSLRLFIEKHSSIEELFIREKCYFSTRIENIYSQLSLSSLHTIKTFIIYEFCGEILSTDLVDNLIRRNPKLEKITIGTENIEFVRSVFKRYFTMEQPCKMKNECGCNEVVIYLNSFRRLDYFLGILREELRELENVLEDIDDFPLSVKFESVTDCKYCYKNKHAINRGFHLLHGL